MGNMYDKYISNPEGTPTQDAVPSFHPEFGFPTGRQPRGSSFFYAKFLDLKLVLKKNVTRYYIHKYH